VKGSIDFRVRVFFEFEISANFRILEQKTNEVKFERVKFAICVVLVNLRLNYRECRVGVSSECFFFFFLERMSFANVFDFFCTMKLFPLERAFG